MAAISTTEQNERAVILLSELKQRLNTPAYKIFPKKGIYAWDKYPKHREFLKATGLYNIIYFQAANRIGKSSFVAWMLYAHATGEYPDIWNGRIFDHPVKCWVIGVTHLQVREVLQAMLTEEALELGDGGFIPTELIVDQSYKQKPTGAFLDLWVRHVPTYNKLKKESGRELTSKEIKYKCSSHIVFKCYQESVNNFKGKKLDILLFDEEPPIDIFTECLLRTMSGKADGKSGLVMIAATPDLGYTPFIHSFDSNENENRKIIRAAWEDVPHLSEEEKRKMLLDIPPHLREAKTRGIPYMGYGMVFPVSPNRYTVDPLEKIPRHWKLINGLDTGANTAAIFAAVNPATNDLYVYAEKAFKDVAIPMIAQTLKEMSKAIYVVDTSINDTNQMDQQVYAREYEKCDVRIEFPVKKLKEAIIAKVIIMMEAGQLTISTDCPELRRQLRALSRDSMGKIEDRKIPDHHTDAFLYLVQGYLNSWARSPSELELEQYNGPAGLPVDNNYNSWNKPGDENGWV